jgi:hypothetical protein
VESLTLGTHRFQRAGNPIGRIDGKGKPFSTNASHWNSRTLEAMRTQSRDDKAMTIHQPLLGIMRFGGTQIIILL